MSRIAAAVILALSMACGNALSQTRTTVDHVTVPLRVEGNRPYISVTFRRADGSSRAARFLVDSGGGGFILTERLAQDIGLKWGKAQHEDGEDFAAADSPPLAFVGRMPLNLNPQRVVVLMHKDNVVPKGAPGHAEGLLPGHVLARYHVVFDYPKKQFTLALPGVLEPKGDTLPMPVSKRSGFPRTEIVVDGVKYGFLIDTGASFTMVSEALLKSWGNSHPDWERHAGAVGEAKTLGGQTLETMFLPHAGWGTRKLEKVGVTSQREGTFERYMSSMMTSPIVGSLAGNILKGFRLELDYPNEKVYVSSSVVQSEERLPVGNGTFGD
jgi:predicted aspartyl protease